jgi:hypothetical protein
MGMAMFVGGPALMMIGVIPDSYRAVMFGVAILGIFIMVIGYVIDIV